MHELFFLLSSAKDPDPLDPQHYGFLDLQSYADPRIRIKAENIHHKQGKNRK